MRVAPINVNSKKDVTKEYLRMMNLKAGIMEEHPLPKGTHIYEHIEPDKKEVLRLFKELRKYLKRSERKIIDKIIKELENEL